MPKILVTSLSLVVVFALTGAGCGNRQANRYNTKSSDSGYSTVPNPEPTSDGYKVYVGTTNEVCNDKEVPEVCKLAGSEFFKDEKGCGCLTKTK